MLHNFSIQEVEFPIGFFVFGQVLWRKHQALGLLILSYNPQFKIHFLINCSMTVKILKLLGYPQITHLPTVNMLSIFVSFYNTGKYRTTFCPSGTHPHDPHIVHFKATCEQKLHCEVWFLISINFAITRSIFFSELL